jgi:hypothetical protein
MEMKKQVLSFNEFINEAYRIINEAEGDGGSIDALKKLLGGGLGLESADQKKFVTVIDRIDSLGMTSTYAEEAKEFAQNITDFLNSKASGVNIKQKGLTDDKEVENKFEWLVNGTIRVKGNPTMRDQGDLGSGIDDDTSVPYPLADVIRGLFSYNLSILNDQMGTSNIKKVANYGKKAKDKKNYPKFLTIDEESLKTDIIQIIDFSPSASDGVKSAVGEYGFAFPIYTINNIIKGEGNELSKDMYTVVIPPNPSESIEEVTDLAYNSSATDFFEENKVIIGEDGKAALNSILSEFHSISKIVVNGGASKKTTTRAGGNEALAKDRMKAGIAMLTQLKKDGVAQLKGATISEGKAVVQSSAATESDPKMQQVSFVISGSIRKIDNKGDAKSLIIQRVDLKKADQVRFKRTVLFCSYDA